MRYNTDIDMNGKRITDSGSSPNETGTVTKGQLTRLMQSETAEDGTTLTPVIIGLNDDVRELVRGLYGDIAFIGDSFLVSADGGGNYTIAAGQCFVGGNLITLESNFTMNINISTSIWIESYVADEKEGDPTTKFTFTTSATDIPNFFVDGTLHTMTRIATIGNGNVVNHSRGDATGEEAQLAAHSADLDPHPNFITTDVLRMVNVKAERAFIKSVTSKPFISVDGVVATVDGDLIVDVGGTSVMYPSGSIISFAPPSLSGVDFSVYATVDGLVAQESHTLEDNANRLVGGFHYGVSGIKEYSCWDLKYRPTCDNPRGMVRTMNGTWCDIYFTTRNYKNQTPWLTSQCRQPPIISNAVGDSGIVSPVPLPAGNTYIQFGYMAAVDLLSSMGKRLPTRNEFAQAAYGITRNARSDVELTMTDDTNALLRSMVGCEQMTGVMNVWTSHIWAMRDGGVHDWHDTGHGNGNVHVSNGTDDSGRVQCLTMGGDSSFYAADVRDFDAVGGSMVETLDIYTGNTRNDIFRPTRPTAIRGWSDHTEEI